jgi:uncharacterized protein (DUF1015 family)
MHHLFSNPFMATVKPFRALRPKPELAERICELPYDVMTSEEARAVAGDNPLSFLHISKPEIDLAPGGDLYSPEVYAKGKENFERLQAEDALWQDPAPCFYLYRQIMGGHTQTGLVAVASCQEYLDNIIKKHEFTRPDKEDDRVRHMETLNAQTGPVFLTYRAPAALDQWLARKTEERPDIDFTAADGVRHVSWRMAGREEIEMLEGEFGKIPSLYIADGHHRSAAAARVYQARQGDQNSGCFLAVIFPHTQMRILPYNRVLRDLNGLPPEQFLEKLEGVCAVKTGGTGHPAGRHEMGLYLKGKWHTLHFHAERTAAVDLADKLDVTLLQKFVLGPILGIVDPRTSKRIHFVGGIRGTEELEKLVNAGEFACAFSMYPTRIEDLMLIADAGGIMPPKSTWFEPKLRDGMFCHMLG